METADFLSQRGAKITIVEALKRSPVLKITSHGYMLHKRLKENNVEFIFNATAQEIGEDYVIVSLEGRKKKLTPVDQVIIAVGLKPRNNLEESWLRKGIRYLIVGDAQQPRRIIEATEEGAKAAWSL